ncbi:hypothetical protein FK529_05415 [Tsukamurella asaccharolytica]|uniref:Alpha/beta hydrolase n=1 Tax=Tsukamurella asaccharolytica TaxID=2592067 RepID=A0A5C5RDM6_9ACTN|nr:hypothetical protein [Tsukamurella asaccharolytica]TWS20768.1 hypothetical protein FK529_05415 [Tsukamurella asaccharolytica]
MTTIVKTRGASEPYGTNFLTPALAPLNSTRFRVVETRYPASIGPVNPAPGTPVGPSLNASVEIGVMNILATVTAAPDDVVLVDYSLGGIVNSAFLSRYGTVGSKVVGRVSLANPTRAAGDNYHFPSFGEGIFGHPVDYQRLGIPHWELASPGDVMTSCHAVSPLRWIAEDVVAGFSLDAKAFAAWAAATVAKLPQIEQRAVGQNGALLWTPDWYQQIFQAPGQLWAYARGGSHTDAYLRPLWRTSSGAPITALALMTKILRDYFGS